jgi:hypothetical protein
MGLKPRPDAGSRSSSAAPSADAALWKAAQAEVHATLVWDDAGRRMLLACFDDSRLTIWQLADAGWQLVAQDKGPRTIGAPVAAYDPSSRTVRIMSTKLETSWSLAGSTLERHAHRGWLDVSSMARDARWDRAGGRLLVSSGYRTVHHLDGKDWRTLPVPGPTHFLLEVPKLGLVGVDNKGNGCRIVGGTPGEFQIPLSMPMLMAVASGGDSILAVTVASKGELRVVKNGKVVKKIAVPLDPTCVAWHPERGVYVVRIMTRKRATIWTCSTTGALTELAG